jgi:hypothetical protein
MDIRIKIYPRKYGYSQFSGNTKEALRRRIGLSYSSNGYHQIGGNSDSIFGINFEKHRRKVKFVKFSKGPRIGKVKSVEVVKRAHWVAYVYEFPKSLPIKIKQNARNFTITQK